MVMAESASAAVLPTFPDNLLIFPNRDFISIQGYSEHKGETATVTVTRPSLGNKVVGSATGVVSGGDVAFEINHPGGVCWGNGTSLKVTPDLLTGDVASISFGGTVVGDTEVQDAFVTQDASVSGSTVTITGHIGAGVDPNNTEQRIVEPALIDTEVARRDIRAIPGPLTPAPRGGYSSALEFGLDGPNTFRATYVFDNPDTAVIAANATLGERLLSWQFVDLAGNRQGVTIAEFGEPGGPGFGGCPNGPLQSGPPGPTDISAVNVSGGVKLTWTPAVAVPGTPAITGYRATAVAATTNAAGEQVEVGKRIANPAATGTTITGLSATESYDIEVVAVSSVGQTFPPVHAVPVTDVTPPTVTASPVGGSYATARNVTLTANEAGSDIYFTTNGVDPVLGDILDASATRYTGPIPVTVDTDLKFVAFDPAGNVSLIGEEQYVITNTPTPAAPVVASTSVGVGSVTLNLTAPDPSITSFSVQAFDAAGATVGAPQVTTPEETAARSVTITGLAPDVPVFFTVTAVNVNGAGDPSAKVGPLTPQGAVVANAGPDQRINRATTATTVNLTASGSTPGGTYAWVQLSPGTTTPMPSSDPDFVTITGASTATPSFQLRLFKYPMTNTPLTFRLTVTTAAGSKSDDVTVTPVPDQVAIATARWKLGDFRVTGSSSVVGGTITIHKGSLSGVSLGQAAVTAAAPPATGGVFDGRFRSTAPPLDTKPATIWIESTLGGVAGPFTVQ
ncbi:MAG TPA: fibronectin type III domain-containing protein [Ornithinibacter sp.]|nr:fibronectin type III domain-containing protein [Ornithinibacter sp.]